MKKEDIVKRIINDKGWNVISIYYNRPRSGFKCVEGGWEVRFKIEYGDNDYYDLFDKYPVIGSATINGGLILSMNSKDLIKLIKSLPDNPSKNDTI